MTTTPLDDRDPGAPAPGTDPIVVSAVLEAAQADVWRAITDPSARLRWWSYLQLEPVVGSRWEEHWTEDGAPRVTSGEVVALHEGELLCLSWADDGWPASTEVEVALEDRGGRTFVQVLHRGWDRLPDGATRREAHRAGWRHHLDNLRAAVEDDG
jgi:uncharacterized protein YndB with AHSA1/START domain